MRSVIVCSIMLTFCMAHSLYAQATAEQIKKEWVGKEWKIIQYETFGMAEDPSVEQAHDKLFLKPDMTFVIVENGKEYQGKWSVQANYIFCKTDSPIKWSKNYKIMSIEAHISTIEYKDPDLTKTLYYLVSE